MNKMTFAAGAAIMAMAASLSACSSDDTTQPVGKNNDKVVRVEAGVEGLATRGNYRPGQTPSEFSITIHNPKDFQYDPTLRPYTYDNVSVTKTGDTWTTAQAMLWANYSDPVDIFAYAPRNNEYNDIYYTEDLPVSVQADQTAIGPEDRSQDFLVYKRTGFVPQNDLTSRGTVRVEFTHALCNFNLRLELGTEFDYPTATDANSISDLAIGGTVISGHCDFVIPSVPTVSVVEGNATTPVKPYMSGFSPAIGGEAGEITNAVAEYECILLPQTVKAEDFYVSFNINGRNFMWRAPREVKLEPNTSYTLKLRAGLDRVVAGEISAKPWTEDNLPDMETE